MEYDNNVPRARAYTRGAATVAQVCDEIQRQPSNTAGVVVFRLLRDIKSSPYRYRGLAVFGVLVELPWLPIAPDLIDENGLPLRATWPQVTAFVPALLAGAPQGLSCAVVFDSAAVGLPRLPVRDAKRAAELARLRGTWPACIEELRTAWALRRPTARRAKYLAAADALVDALAFETARFGSA